MFRIHCSVSGHDHLMGIESARDLQSTTQGVVAYVECVCGSMVILEGGVQTWHETNTKTRVVA